MTLALRSAAPANGGAIPGSIFDLLERSALSVDPGHAQDLFLDAIENYPPEERHAFVESACRGNAALFRRIRQLLAAHEANSEFMNRPAAELLGVTIDGAAASPGFESFSVGSLIDRYTLIEKLGEGGMGAVFLASQSDPVERLVALKIIRSGMDTQQLVARFSMERQTLALMSHPGIARVLDAGSTPAGRPYFVMDLVRGSPITQFCDVQQLPIRDRLELLIGVCEAVEHAHFKGIIHRDLKPGNILVESGDIRPNVKVIDFGVAAAIGQTAAEGPSVGQLLATPLYMSPEQADLGNPDIDTRSDVYSLGVILYELLTGQTPYSADLLRPVAAEDLREFIGCRNPATPSELVQTLPADRQVKLALDRGIRNGRLAQVLRAELDVITMKALHKERAQRYQSPMQLASELRRFLDNRLVEACASSARYRLKKTFLRYRGMLMITAGLLLTLITGLVVSLDRAAVARNAQRQANHYLARATEENDRFRQLAWRSGIQQACAYWERNCYAETHEILEHLAESDAQSRTRPEWQVLRQELNRRFRIWLECPRPLNEIRISGAENAAVVVGGDGQLTVFDLSSGQLLRKVATGIPSLNALALSPDGLSVAVGGVTDPVTDLSAAVIYDIRSLQRIQQLSEQATTIESLQFSADSRYLASGARYENLRLTDLLTGEFNDLPLNRRHLWISGSEHSGQLAVSNSPGSVHVSGFGPPFDSYQLTVDGDVVRAMWIPGTDLLICLAQNDANLEMHALCPATRELIHLCSFVEGAGVEVLEISADQTVLLAGLATGDLVAWPFPFDLIEAFRVKRGRAASEIKTTAVASSPTLIARTDRWHVSTAPVTSVAYHDGLLLATTNSGEFVSVDPQKQIQPSPPAADRVEGQRITARVASPDGKRMLVGRVNGRVEHGTVTENSQRGTGSQLPGQSARFGNAADVLVDRWETISASSTAEVLAVAYSPDQRLLAFSHSNEEVVLVRDGSPIIVNSSSTADGSLHASIDTLQFSPSSEILAWTGGRELCLTQIRDEQGESRRFPLPGLGDCMAWSADGRFLIIGGNFHQILELDVESGQMTTLADYGTHTRVLCCSTDGNRVISGHGDGSVRFWNRVDQSVKSLHLHETELRALTLTADEKIGISGDESGRQAMWFTDPAARIGILHQPRRHAKHRYELSPQTVFCAGGGKMLRLSDGEGSNVLVRSWTLSPAPSSQVMPRF